MKKKTKSLIMGAALLSMGIPGVANGIVDINNAENTTIAVAQEQEHFNSVMEELGASKSIVVGDTVYAIADSQMHEIAVKDDAIQYNDVGFPTHETGSRSSSQKLRSGITSTVGGVALTVLGMNAAINGALRKEDDIEGLIM